MTLNCKGPLIALSTPKVMGILNVTPDSFYDGGKYKNMEALLGQVDQMLQAGATFIDLGAYSSRPRSEHISETEELSRIVPVVTLLLKEFPDILMSIDTFRAKVAKACLGEGAAMINDISAGHLDSEMLPTVAAFQVPYIMMHMRGTPQTMQQQTGYGNLVQEVLYYFSERIAAARTLGMKDLIIDPGFGFAKTLSQNYELLGQLRLFHTFELPLMVGVSRKSMIQKVIDTDAKDALNGTTALHAYALTKGAQILRTHDVKEAIQCIKLMQRLAPYND
ncbi:MAG: dihydropteroate synthase [Flavobacteriales bacterium]|nr:MAG: dihydropteroate synthase [Flavobacteriales bacterium]